MESSAFSFLPLSVQMNILSMVDSKTQKEMTTSQRELLPRVSLQCEDASSLTILSKEEIELFNTTGFFVKDDFLGIENLRAYYSNAEQLFENGKMRPAGMGGQSSELWKDSSVRSDHIVWLNDIEDREKWSEEEAGCLRKLVQKVKLIQTELNQSCNFDSHETQIQLTCYPGDGSRYVRHLDSYVGATTRRITCLYYLNPEYSAKDPEAKKLGGDLRIFHHDSDSEFTDISPVGDRLLVFQSRLLEHEVLPSYFKRFAITVWFY